MNRTRVDEPPDKKKTRGGKHKKTKQLLPKQAWQELLFCRSQFERRGRRGEKRLERGELQNNRVKTLKRYASNRNKQQSVSTTIRDRN